MGVSAPGAGVCCACMHEEQSRRRQRVPNHTLPRTDPTKSCAVTVRCMTLALELNVIIGAPLGGLCAWPDSPALPRASVLAQAAGVCTLILLWSRQTSSRKLAEQGMPLCSPPYASSTGFYPSPRGRE